jgi:F-type H+-transporting ATPase subunit delta
VIPNARGLAGSGAARGLAAAKSQEIQALCLFSGPQGAPSFERAFVTVTDQTVSGVPGRYATALFELAQETKSVDKVGADLASFQKLLDESPDLKRLVRSPVFSAKDQVAALTAVAKGAGIDGTALNFLKLIAQNRRLFAVEGMIKAYRALVAAQKGEVQAEVVSAEPLSDRHIGDLKAALKAKIGQDVQLQTRTDPAILGGLIVKVGSRMIDTSLRTKLQNLKIAMKGTG